MHYSIIQNQIPYLLTLILAAREEATRAAKRATACLKAMVGLVALRTLAAPYIPET